MGSPSGIYDGWGSGGISSEEVPYADTMISARSVFYTLVLFSELSSHLVTVAMPPAKVEDEGLGLILGDEPAVVPPIYRRMDAQDSSPRDGRSKVIVVSVSVTFDLLKTSLSAGLFSFSRKIFWQPGCVSKPHNHLSHEILLASSVHSV